MTNHNDCHDLADRCGTEEGAHQVEKIQWSLLESLQPMLKANHPDDPFLVAKLLALLADLRSLAQMHKQEIVDILNEYSSIPVPPAVYETILCL